MSAILCEMGRTPRLATKILVKGPPCPAAFLLIVWMECTGVPGTLGVPTKVWASRGGCSDVDCESMIVVEKGETVKKAGREDGFIVAVDDGITRVRDDDENPQRSSWCSSQRQNRLSYLSMLVL